MPCAGALTCLFRVTSLTGSPELDQAMDVNEFDEGHPDNLTHHLLSPSRLQMALMTAGLQSYCRADKGRDSISSK